MSQQELLKRVVRVLDEAGVEYVPTPEDVILAKLHWAKTSDGSEKQLLDALRVYEVQSALLDRTYLDRWAEQLSVTDLWLRVQAKAETL